MSDNIPYEIQLEIIKKVPEFKSLIRFRSVSKQWMSFIDSPEFIAFYGVRQSQPHRLLLRYKEIIDPREFKHISFVDDVTFPQQQQDFSPNVSDLVKHLKYSKVIGSSCGLWCFHNYSSITEMVVIWNPSIGKSVGIVVPRLLNNSPISPGHMQFTTLGFGVCPSTYDPTIVRMSYIARVLYIGDTNNIPWEVEVLTLSSKTWKMIPSSNLPRESVRLISSTQVAIDRFIFWVAYDSVSQFKTLILSFDLITHEFKEVNLPDSLANRDISISKLNESLVVSALTNEVNGIVYGVWMMGMEGGVMTSFTKLFNIKKPDDLLISKVLGFKKSGEPIMETVKEDEQFAVLEVYEPCSQHINNLGIYGVFGSLFICPYKETLLLADHSDGYIFSNDY
ncbi:F-box protein-like protein [Tanacetum coccineum]